MSVSLISRQLTALKIAQRAVVPWLASARPSTVVAASHINSTTTTQTSTNYLQQLPTQFDITARSFSTTENAITTNDDGGPVTKSADFADMSNKELADMSTIPGWNLVTNPPRRNNPRGALIGKVVSDKMQKTVNVAVDRFKMIPKYRKRWRFTRKFMAHDEHEVCNMGDLVMIVPCQKISRHKNFMVREIIRPKGQL